MPNRVIMMVEELNMKIRLGRYILFILLFLVLNKYRRVKKTLLNGLIKKYILPSF